MLGRQGGRGEEEIRGREAGRQCDTDGGFSSSILASLYSNGLNYVECRCSMCKKGSEGG